MLAEAGVRRANVPDADSPRLIWQAALSQGEKHGTPRPRIYPDPPTPPPEAPQSWPGDQAHRAGSLAPGGEVISFIWTVWACGGTEVDKDSTIVATVDADADTDSDSDSDADADTAHTGSYSTGECQDECDRDCGEDEYAGLCLTYDTGDGTGVSCFCMSCGTAC